MMTRILYVISLANIIFTIESHAAAAMPERPPSRKALVASPRAAAMPEKPPRKALAASSRAEADVDFERDEIDVFKLLAYSPRDQLRALSEIAFRPDVKNHRRFTYNRNFYDCHLFRTLQTELGELLARPYPIPELPTVLQGLSIFLGKLATIDSERHIQFREEAYYYDIMAWSRYAFNNGLLLVPTSLMPNPFCAHCPAWISSFTFQPFPPVPPAPLMNG